MYLLREIDLIFVAFQPDHQPITVIASAVRSVTCVPGVLSALVECFQVLEVLADLSLETFFVLVSVGHYMSGCEDGQPQEKQSCHHQENVGGSHLMFGEE